ncbi:MAG: bifunctional diaminohydroxyphosphoribosylaminopyrimidine deaminase/5-amino-6-(5-phosphoribosylamino)uracil reductase RibD [Bacteroidales bacterium]|jgi:diaminohydroxyphosphoribosylaminopyrimidine deaminase/5-amino-6-(5-phosphoribosylamino)uracil reductase|nr:bifunctional diaminohydroxyphosphoribosylaminopyrimidine deaminase/5-amino-6-(5-phosphoribosylamino)uracil reductase RibD [Bacteroidales bacterium]
MTKHEKYIKRCIELAGNGIGNVSPNPMVGSVIVFNDKIIGEGYHCKFGEAHAEVNAINSVKDKELLKKSTIYVSLEPCAHVGKTPACADLIIKMQIPEVVIGSVDPYFEVDGKGIKKLMNSSVNVVSGILEKECKFLNRRFYTFHTKKRPYIILKWAQTFDGFIDYSRKPGTDIGPAWITNEYCKTLVHKWRTEEDAILAGKNTVILDNPQLTARNWYGKDPVRICIDKMCELKSNYNIFNSNASVIVVNSIENLVKNNIKYVKINFSENILPQLMEILYDENIQSVIVEGGTKTLNEFIENNLWDEARVFYGSKEFKTGVKAPIFERKESLSEKYGDSELKIYYN